VEIQRAWNRLFPERSFAYLAKMYASSLKAGEPFSKAIDTKLEEEKKLSIIDPMGVTRAQKSALPSFVEDVCKQTSSGEEMI